MNPETGLFLCRECVRAYANHPNPPSKSQYTLKLVDNQKELTKAMEHMRRVRVQLSSKVDMQSQPLRKSIFDLLQKVRAAKGAEPITSNLPSENIALGIGSSRIAGTGRTAGILLKKQQKQGIVAAGADAAGGAGGDAGRRRGVRDGGRPDDDDLTWLKNAIGQEVAFDLDRGGGARAHLLATRGPVRHKLVDAAAMRAGVDLGLVADVLLAARDRARRKREREKEEEEGGGGGGRKKKRAGELHFLRDNLGAAASALGALDARSKEEREKRRLGHLDGDASSEEEEEPGPQSSYYIPDETDELRNLPEEDRRAAFQAQYKGQVERQKKLLGIKSLDEFEPVKSPADWEEGLYGIAWEDG